ncbi:hypothetical protein PPYR_03903 [Photinus pyralis]|uniref:HOOK N-terminal domain-containing protein n=2 Tax=Photinus pyralis TaxID=7054 RepID=A0A1Y1L9J0_PHOPY|nr:girdin [Photinus pyralis]XP_031332431.1 girdin [Photinus pyralis]KAB0801717.1 hypothetical protein PPYR_03903 [Photinus pyralis]
MAASQADIEEFLGGPLVSWLGTCVKKPETLQVYETFFDGGPISEVLLLIDPEPAQPIPSPLASLQSLNITTNRIRTFHCIVKNIKCLYEEELGQVVVALPDCITLGRTPASQTALEQMRLLLLLLLGCAVQGPTKEYFISKIKELSLDTQHDIVECIKQVTEGQNVVLTLDWADQSAERLYTHVRSLASERDNLLHKWITDLNQEPNVSNSNITFEGVESNHRAVELADMKARLRKQRQELEEKSEILAECREELEHANMLLSKLKMENSDLLVEIRKAKVYRDEADAMREKAERADKLENEAIRYRERLADADFYKVRVDELREDNRVLMETREMLEAQLARSRQRTDHVLQLEAELLTCKQNINDFTLERDAAKEKIQELIEENIQLQQVTKSALQETSLSNIQIDSDKEETNSGDNSLSEQLTNNAQARALKLELENQKLLSTIDSLKEHNFHDSSNKILDLEKEKKRLALKCSQLQDNCDRLNRQNTELEALFKNALQENRKLQDTMDTGKVISDRQSQELQHERLKVQELEKNMDILTKEKQRVHTLCDTIRKRADDADKSLNQMLEQVQHLQAEVNRTALYEKLNNEQKEKIVSLEKENANMHKDITKLKHTIEEKDVTLDQFSVNSEKQAKEISELCKEKTTSTAQIEKLQEYEQKAQELLSQAAVYTETIATLQKDLISEKVTNEKFKANLERLGLNIDILDNDINVIVEKMLSNPDLSKNIYSLLQPESDEKCKNCSETLHIDDDVLKQAEQVVSSISAEWNQQCEKLVAEVSSLQQINESLQTDNAKMQVEISTLASQVNSLTTQQTALQLANSQLVAEKEEMSKQQKVQSTQHDTLLLDQATLRSLHEQLYTEYDEMKKEQDQIKKGNRDLRSEIRVLKDINSTLEKKITSLELEKDALKNESKSLGNLRAEHSKLKDDFRNLFTASERLKTEYRALQEEYKSLRAESGKLRLGNTEMQGELSSRSDLVSGLQLDNAKLQQKCDMLLEMNHSLDTDRRALMDHVSQLLSQYHSLLTHSLEDKQHYHLEEKQFTDKLNNLCRQKEKLEEKIMEHYRKLDNASSKKKGFGSTLVRRMRKAGSDIINKVPSRNRRSWHEESRLSQSQFTLGGGSGESGGNDSDNSIDESGKTNEHFKRSTGSLHGHKPRDEVTVRRSHRDLTSHRNSIASDQVYSQREQGSALSLGSIGTRRTVYLSDDDPSVATANKSPAPLLVYNRISTVIGDTQSSSTGQTAKTVEESTSKETTEKKKSDNPRDNAIWYEYGCV